MVVVGRLIHKIDNIFSAIRTDIKLHKFITKSGRIKRLVAVNFITKSQREVIAMLKIASVSSFIRDMWTTFEQSEKHWRKISGSTPISDVVFTPNEFLAAHLVQEDNSHPTFFEQYS